jgi:hypothetical protein
MMHLGLASSVEVGQGLLDTGAHGLLALANPDTGVEVLLVWLVSTVGVADRGRNVVLLVDHVVSDTAGVSVLGVGVDVDLDNTVADGVKVLLLLRAGATVEHEEHGGFGLAGSLEAAGGELLLDVGLVLAQELGVQLDVARLVDTVDVAEASSDGEVRGDGLEGLVDVPDILGLGVERGVVDGLVVDTVLLTTGDADLLLCDGQRAVLQGKLALFPKDISVCGKRTISSHCFMGAARFRYLAVVSMFHSTGSSDRSIM